MISHRLSCSIWRSRSEEEEPDPAPPPNPELEPVRLELEPRVDATPEEAAELLEEVEEEEEEEVEVVDEEEEEVVPEGEGELEAEEEEEEPPSPESDPPEPGVGEEEAEESEDIPKVERGPERTTQKIKRFFFSFPSFLDLTSQENPVQVLTLNRTATATQLTSSACWSNERTKGTQLGPSVCLCVHLTRR